MICEVSGNLFDLNDCIAYITCKGAKDLAYRLEKRLEPYNITRVQWTAMYYVGKEKLITQKMLSEKMSLKEPTVVRLIDRMEKEGLLHRVRCKLDKRIHHLELTQKGIVLCEKLNEVAEQFKNDAISNINPQDLCAFMAVLEQMLENTEVG